MSASLTALTEPQDLRVPQPARRSRAADHDNAEPHDDELVRQARAGSREAFNELVRRHRARALGWASALVPDGHLAEDVVQEALIQAFMKLGQLVDQRRFAPWLRTIVRNEAYMKLRRGGPYRRERPFSSFLTTSREAQPRDWSDLDQILARLAEGASRFEAGHGDPAERLSRQAAMAEFNALLHCLTARERAIFEAYFFAQLPPEEIARLFETTTGSVYNHISRSRRKVRRARIAVYIGAYVAERRAQGAPRRKLIDVSALQL